VGVRKLVVSKPDRHSSWAVRVWEVGGLGFANCGLFAPKTKHIHFVSQRQNTMAICGYNNVTKPRDFLFIATQTPVTCGNCCKYLLARLREVSA
jgi:hypothetical protein